MNSPSSYQIKLAQYLKMGLSPKTLKKITAMSDVLETGRFLYNAGYYKTLLKFSLNNLRKKKKVPWPFVMKTLTDHNITFSTEAAKTLLESLLSEYKEKHPWLSACGEWAEISPEFQEFIQFQRKQFQSRLQATNPNSQEGITMKPHPSLTQTENLTSRNTKTTKKIETLQQSEQTDYSVLYKPEDSQPEIAPGSEQSNPEEVLTSPIQTTEEKKETEKPSVVFSDNSLTETKTQKDTILNPDTHSKQSVLYESGESQMERAQDSEQLKEGEEAFSPIENKSNQPELNPFSEQFDPFIQRDEQPEQAENSAFYKKEEAYPNITTELNESQLLKQLEFVQAKELIEAEKKIIAILLKKNPEKYKQLETELKIKEALHLLQKKKTTGKGEKESHWPLSQEVSEKTPPQMIQLCKETSRLAEKYPEKAKYLAIFLYTMGRPEEAIKILEKNIQTPSDYWFYLNWLMEIKQYAIVLDMTNQLLTTFKPHSESLFPITYIKAQALYALGEKDKAISYMSDIVKVRPEYKSARHFIEQWTEA